MPRRVRISALLAIAAALLCGCAPAGARSQPREREVELGERERDRTMTELALPRPTTHGELTLEAAIAQRRSRRDIASTPLSPGEIGQLCWVAQGVTGEEGLRAAPSAGALYPLELHVATTDGVFHYDPARHALRRTSARDVRAALRDAAYGQAPVGDAPIVLVLSGVEARTARRYGERASRYVALEAGHAAQNVLLQAESLGLAAVPIGAFADDAVQRAVGLGDEASPLYLVPVGRPR